MFKNLIGGIAVVTVTSVAIAIGQSGAPFGRDLEGIWDFNSMTPLQRPAELAGQSLFTPEQAVEYERDFFQRGMRALGPDAPLQADLNDVYMTPPKLDGLRTSLIVDPADGRLPARVPAAATRPGFRRSYDDPESLTLVERCIVAAGALSNGTGSLASPPLVPVTVVDDRMHIVQTSNAVVIASEWIHDARVVRIGGTHLPHSVRRWLGDSIGHWEGNTLVVDTTNFRSETMNQGASANLHVVERFTRIAADVLRYRVTAEDRETWIRPWTAEWSFRSTTEPLIEVACHEGNYNTENFLRGARADEQRAAAAKDRER
jgi:hypothetical protein